MSLHKVVQRIFVNTQIRCISSSNSRNNKLQLGEKTRKNCVLKEAEKVVGYPTSFLSLRWILNDEIANVATHIRKLIGTNHPLLETAKSLLVRNDLPTWGLIILLVSKMAGYNSKFSDMERDKTADILHSQRILAEVTEMIKTSTMIHKGIIETNSEDTESASILNFGNKLALLSGDYLLSTSFQEVARLKNSQVQETISVTLRDLTESEFIGLRTKTNEPIPTKPLKIQKDVKIPVELGSSPFKVENVLGNMKAEWILRNILGGGSLLGKCCQSTVILANHGEKVQENSYSFGRNLALAWQACLELNLFREGKFSLVSAPVMMHLEDQPSLYREIEKGLFNDKINYDLIREEVMNGAGIEKTFKLQKEFSQNAIDMLDQFPDNESKRALVNIVKSM